MRLGASIGAASICLWTAIAGGAPPHPELVAVRDRLLEWLPGEYESYPQVAYERRHGAPPDGEHEHWYRVFARIDAPQLGEHVIYGELYQGGPGGQLVAGQQIVYIVEIDPDRHVVNVLGSGIKDRERFERLHEKPDLQGRVELHGLSGNCDFRWRRSGVQIVGKLNDDGRCTYVSPRSGRTMTWDAEWVLGPDQLWIFDNGYIDGQGLWIGREDRTHTRFYRMRQAACVVTRADGTSVELTMHDRGGQVGIGDDGTVVQLMRGPQLGPQARWYADALTLSVLRGEQPVAQTLDPDGSRSIVVRAHDARIECDLPATDGGQHSSRAAGRPTY